jgi:uncharacterized protein DUF5666
MRRIAAISAGVLIAAFVAGGTAGAQGTKTVRGTVSKAAADAVTVKVGDKDMTFKVDSTTQVTARGGSTATRTAKAEGKPGPVLTDIIKMGQGVQVDYHEKDMHAANIRVLPTAPSASAAPAPAEAQTAKTMSASGTVTAVTSSSLTVKATAGESTFTIDAKTKVIGTGAGTKGKEIKEAGAKPQITDFVSTGDTVSVRYREEGGAKLASEVRVTKKAKS